MILTGRLNTRPFLVNNSLYLMNRKIDFDYVFKVNIIAILGCVQNCFTTSYKLELSNYTRVCGLTSLKPLQMRWQTGQPTLWSQPLRPLHNGNCVVLWSSGKPFKLQSALAPNTFLPSSRSFGHVRCILMLVRCTFGVYLNVYLPRKSWSNMVLHPLLSVPSVTFKKILGVIFWSTVLENGVFGNSCSLTIFLISLFHPNYCMAHYGSFISLKKSVTRNPICLLYLLYYMLFGLSIGNMALITHNLVYHPTANTLSPK
jgi:hypothetical protein